MGEGTLVSAWIQYRTRETSVTTKDRPPMLPKSHPKMEDTISEFVLVTHSVGGQPTVSEGYLSFQLHEIGADAWYVIGTPYPVTVAAWMPKPQPFDGDGYLVNG